MMALGYTSLLTIYELIDILMIQEADKPAIHSISADLEVYTKRLNMLINSEIQEIDNSEVKESGYESLGWYEEATRQLFENGLWDEIEKEFKENLESLSSLRNTRKVTKEIIFERYSDAINISYQYASSIESKPKLQRNIMKSLTGQLLEELINYPDIEQHHKKNAVTISYCIASKRIYL